MSGVSGQSLQKKAWKKKPSQNDRGRDWTTSTATKTCLGEGVLKRTHPQHQNQYQNVILQNFGRFLSLRPEIVLISPKFPNYRVFRENLFISEIDQSLGSIWHFPQKSSPKRTIILFFITLFFLKNQKMQEYFSIIIFVCTGA